MFKKNKGKEEPVNENTNPFEQTDKENAEPAQEEQTREEKPQENQTQESKTQESKNITEVISAEEKIKNELDEMKNQYIRLAADFDNYRKRQAQEREALLKYGAEETLKKLLPVMDTFNRAQSSLAEMDDAEKIKESFNVVFKQFADALEKAGLKKVETVGTEFDPSKHEAIIQTPTNDHPDHSIIAELQSGYALDDRVLRAALVNVAVNE